MNVHCPSAGDTRHCVSFGQYLCVSRQEPFTLGQKLQLGLVESAYSRLISVTLKAAGDDVIHGSVPS